VIAERLADWSSMAGRGVTVGDLRAVVNPSLETAGKTFRALTFLFRAESP
jgi:hypothetical protein